MDSFWKLLDEIQKTAFYTVVSEFAVIDWVVTFFILFGMLQGSRKGCVEMLAQTFQIFLVIIFTLTFYPALGDYLSTLIPPLSRKMADPLVFIPLAGFVWFTVAWLFNLVGKIFKVEVSSFLKFLGGVIFGGLFCALLLSFFIQVVLFIPGEAVRKPFTKQGSYTGSAIAKLAPRVQEAVVFPFQNPKRSAQTPAN